MVGPPAPGSLAGTFLDRYGGHNPQDRSRLGGKENNANGRHRKEKRTHKINYNFFAISLMARTAGLPQICPF